MRAGKTIGAKLLGAFAALIVMILVPLAAYLSSGRQAHHQLEEVLNRFNRKLAIGVEVELATTEMQGSQRGLMLSYAMQDPGASNQYTDLYANSGLKIDALMAELQPLLDQDVEKQASGEIQRNRAEWAPRFQKLVELCRSGMIDEAYKLRNENKAISARMHAAATQLVKQQRSALEKTKGASEASIVTSNWIATIVTGLCISVSLLLLLTVRREIAKLRRGVADLQHAASEVAGASGQLAASSQAVAQGASEQATTIEETSSSTEQIASATRQNTDQLEKAADLTRRTGTAVEGANQALGEMQASMKEINGACEKVGQIIRVIDEIAFQTNILALNAAVESARAGESGRGFAVVADEVRNLARRSANAASETTGLIEESIAKSRRGRQDLETVSGAISKLTSNAHAITGLLDQVRSGSTEQNRGVERIASSMSRIGQVTQQSAAAAEETAAVSQEMSAQANTLKGIVQRLHEMVG